MKRKELIVNNTICKFKKLNGVPAVHSASVVELYEIGNSVLKQHIQDMVHNKPSLKTEFKEVGVHYLMTQKGFTLVSNKLVHPKALDFQEAMYDGFVALSQEKAGTSEPLSIPEMLRLGAEAMEKVEKMTPNYELVERIKVDIKSIMMSDWSRLLHKKGGFRVSSRDVFRALRALGYMFRRKTKPMQFVLDNGWMEYKYTTGNDGREYQTPFVTIEGMKAMDESILDYLKDD